MYLKKTWYRDWHQVFQGAAGLCHLVESLDHRFEMYKATSADDVISF
jgi:hypothetical protein